MMGLESPEVFWRYPPDLAVLPRARRDARRFLQWAGVNEPCALAGEIVVNELMISSITHAGTELLLCVSAPSTYVRVAVQDRSPTGPVWSGPGSANGGLSLTIAKALADHVFCDYRATTKTVWAEIARHDPPEGQN